MELQQLKNELSIQSKNGIPFLLSATIIWIIITIIFSLDLQTTNKNIIMLYATGLMFPLSITIAKFIKADWKSKDHPLGALGFQFNLAQTMYFPLLAWAFVKSPSEMILFFAIITAAHFYPFGWVYNTKAYYIMAPVISVGLMVIGWNRSDQNLWLMPLTMVFSLLILVGWLILDYKRKVKSI